MRDLLEGLRDAAARQGVDFMDVRAVEEQGTYIQLQDGRVDKLNQSQTRGLGIRVLMNRAWGFASVDGYDRRQALDCLEMAIALARASQERVGEMGVLSRTGVVEQRLPATFEKDPRSVPLSQKMQLLSQYEQAGIASGGGPSYGGRPYRKPWTIGRHLTA